MTKLINNFTGEIIEVPPDNVVRVRCDGQVTVMHLDGSESVYESCEWDYQPTWADIWVGCTGERVVKL